MRDAKLVCSGGQIYKFGSTVLYQYCKQMIFKF